MTINIHMWEHIAFYTYYSGFLVHCRFRTVANRLLMAIFIGKLLLEHFAVLNGEFYSSECLLLRKKMAHN